MGAVLIPTQLRSYTGGETEVHVEGASLADILEALDARYPGIRFRIIDEQDRIREHIRIFVRGEDARTIQTPVAPDEEIQIVGALSGG